MKMKTKDGISLIVLVITIIIMIILAAAIILSLSSNGMLGKANDAKTNTTISNVKEQGTALVAEYELRVSTGELKESEIDVETYVKNALKKNGMTDEELKLVQVMEDRTVYVYKKPKIPAGFVKSSIETEDDVVEGMVIYEGTEPVTELNHEDAMEERNQYVWIPVPEMHEFVRRDGYEDRKLQTWVSGNRAKEPANSWHDGERLSQKNDLTGEYAEYAKIISSITKYGGFYIGRYEAGTTTARTDKEGGNGTSFKDDGITPDVLFQKEKFPYNNVAWGPSVICVTGNIIDLADREQGIGVVELSRNIYPENSNNEVVSTLIYGVQWDAAMWFMRDVQNPNVTAKKYIEDSSNMGWYSNNSSNNKHYITGKDVDSNSSNMVKNIYDMAGNLYEWTMEGGSTTGRIVRGILTNGLYSPASYRNNRSPLAASEYLGFRVALYLK